MSTWELEQQKGSCSKTRTALVAREGAADLAVVVGATDAGEPVAARRTWSPGETATKVMRYKTHFQCLEISGLQASK